MLKHFQHSNSSKIGNNADSEASNKNSTKMSIETISKRKSSHFRNTTSSALDDDNNNDKDAHYQQPQLTHQLQQQQQQLQLQQQQQQQVSRLQHLQQMQQMHPQHQLFKTQAKQHKHNKQLTAGNKGACTKHGAGHEPSARLSTLIALFVSIAAGLDSQIFNALLLVNAQFGGASDQAPRKFCGHEFIDVVDMVCDGKYYDGLSASGGDSSSGGPQISQPIITMPGVNMHTKRHLSGDLADALINGDPLFVEAALGEYEDAEAQDSKVHSELALRISDNRNNIDTDNSEHQIGSSFARINNDNHNMQLNHHNSRKLRLADEHRDDRPSDNARKQLADFVVSKALAKLEEERSEQLLLANGKRQQLAQGRLEDSIIDSLAPLLRNKRSALRTSMSGDKTAKQAAEFGKQPLIELSSNAALMRHKLLLNSEPITSLSQLTKADKKYLRLKLRSMRRYKRNSGFKSDKKNCCKQSCSLDDLRLFCSKE